MSKYILWTLTGLLAIFGVYLGLRKPDSGQLADKSAQSASSRLAGTGSQPGATRDAASPSKSVGRPGSEALERVDGLKHGLETDYFADGKKQWERRYEHGKPEGAWIKWHENGTKWQEIQYVNGKKDGAMNQWHSNGRKWVESNYQNGILHGTTIVWGSEGQEISSVRYWKGKALGQAAQPTPQPITSDSEDGVQE